MSSDVTPFIILAGIAGVGYYGYTQGWFNSKQVAQSNSGPPPQTAVPLSLILNGAGVTPAFQAQACNIWGGTVSGSNCVGGNFGGTLGPSALDQWHQLACAVANSVSPNSCEVVNGVVVSTGESGPLPGSSSQAPSLQSQVAGLSLGNALLKVASLDSNTKQTVDQWNYYLGEIWPNAQQSDLSEVNIVRGQNDLMLVANYVYYRSQAHLPDPTQAGMSGLGILGYARVPVWAIHQRRA